MRALHSRPIETLPPWLLLQVQGLLQMVHYPHPPLVQSQGADPFCNDVLGSMMLGHDQAWASGQGSDDVVGPRREFAKSRDRAGGQLWCILLLGLESHIFKFGFFSERNHQRVCIDSQCVYCVVGRLGFFLHGFFFRFKGFFRCFIVLILCWFNHEELVLFAVMFVAPRFIAMPTQLLGRSFAKLVSCQFFWCKGLDDSRGGSRPRHGWLGSDPCPSYLVVQLFILDTREENYRHKSVWLSRLYFSNLQL
ncbi:hypothetical protein GW17_00035656 [Ensete ventricosum]|nr:hypothetical protein GW17_00035656 [Ensete ventricosum]